MRYLLIICLDDTFQPTPGPRTGHSSLGSRDGRPGNSVGRRPAASDCGKRSPSVCAPGSVWLWMGRSLTSPFNLRPIELIDVPDRQAALDAAASHPMAGAALIEVRPVWQELAG